MTLQRINQHLLPTRIAERSACLCGGNVCQCYAKRFGIRLASEFVASVAAARPDVDMSRAIKAASKTLVYSHEGMRFEKAGFSLDKELDANEIEYRKQHGITPVMDFEAVITTTNKDRDSDVLECEGAEVDPVMPLLWQHIPEMPIGKFLRVTYRDKNIIKGASSIIDSPLGRDAAQLLEFGALRISHGFKPKRVEQMQQAPDDLWPGYRIPAYRMFEKSLVSVPSNPDAVITAYSRNKLFDPMVKAWAKSISDARPTMVRGGYDPMNGAPPRIKRYPLPAGETEALRWNESLSKSFDVDNAELVPSSTLIDWVGKWLEVPTKSIFQTSFPIPSVRMGTLLTAFKTITAEMGFKEASTRNIWGATESPPQYEKVELNSTKSDSFLVLGTTFFNGRDKIVVDYQRDYWGVEIKLFSTWSSRSIVDELCDKSLEWGERNNFLRGEKFAVSGKFLQKSTEDFADLFLEPENEKALSRVLDRLNAKGASFRRHGMILQGPPGTGKTLSGRIFLNKAAATFIWVSAKDFYRMGAFGGLSMAFSLAKELRPSVLFIEDVDNWLDSWSIDYLKSEMDGIDQQAGMLTMLTTNFPELLPAAIRDRPGRFHETLDFNLPTADVRGKMLAKWMPKVSAGVMAKAVSGTDGMSGAHIYHLCKFADDLVESESTSYDDAIILAIEKTIEQRELINDNQLAGSRYRPGRDFDGAITKSMGVWIKGAVPFKATPKKDVTAKWDVDGATYRVREWAGVYGDGDKPTPEAWKKYAGAFGWFDAENGDSFDAFKLLHHDVIDDKLVVVWEAVKEAMAAVLGARGESGVPDADRRKVYAHLSQHYRQFEKPVPAFKGGPVVCAKCQSTECTCGGNKAAKLTERRLGLIRSAQSSIKQAQEHEEMNEQDEAKSFLSHANYKLVKAMPMMEEDDDEEDEPDGPDKSDVEENGSGGDGEKPRKTATLTEKRLKLLRQSQDHMMDAHDHDGMNGKSLAQAIIKSAFDLVEQAIPVPKKPKNNTGGDGGQSPGTKPLDPASNPGIEPMGANAGVEPMKPNPEVMAAVNGLAVKFLTAVRAGSVEWQTLHDVRDGVDEEINRQEQAAVNAPAEAIAG